jgi:hypothetical protein
VRVRSAKRAVFGTKQSSGTLILRFGGQSQKMTGAGWLKSFILPILGWGTLIL